MTSKALASLFSAWEWSYRQGRQQGSELEPLVCRKLSSLDLVSCLFEITAVPPAGLVSGT